MTVTVDVLLPSLSWRQTETIRDLQQVGNGKRKIVLLSSREGARLTLLVGPEIVTEQDGYMHLDLCRATEEVGVAGKVLGSGSLHIQPASGGLARLLRQREARVVGEGKFYSHLTPEHFSDDVRCQLRKLLRARVTF